MHITINTSNQKLNLCGHKKAMEYPCAIGKNGAIPMVDGREGDGKTPLGVYKFRYGLYRKDRLELPQTDLVFWPIRNSDGWCDAPDDPAYNRPVCLPYPASTELLWRDDGLYDIILVISHNDSPPVPNMGSAVFIHIARENYTPTEGCIALSQDNMMSLIPQLNTSISIEISN